MGNQVLIRIFIVPYLPRSNIKSFIFVFSNKIKNSCALYIIVFVLSGFPYVCTSRALLSTEKKVGVI